MIDQHTDFFEYVDNFAKTVHIPSIPIFESKLEYIPEITIAIPTYKRADLLKEAIDSAINQVDYSNYDIIVVDNNPERGCETEKLMMSYNDPKISYYKNAENLGMVGNWNRLFILAKGKYVVMLHDDDMLLPFYLQKVQHVISKLKISPDAIYFPTIISSSIKINEDRVDDEKSMFVLKLKPFDFLFGNIVWIVGACFKRVTVINSGGFSDMYYPSFDYAFFVRLCKRSKSFSITGQPTTMYRISENESLKTCTMLNFIEMDNRIKTNILSSYSIKFYKLFDSLFRVKDYTYLKNMSVLFNNNDPILEKELSNKLDQVTLFDRIISRIMILLQRISLRFRRHTIM